ncbi:hypothetical protein EmuJ_000986100 [Echinococcus multilocularis]|uniref:Uncharacterized protein n=1 Tax=Echinococcus multilocularis TaxID=6211 RepID=U6HXN3_ECHMU|nr:hypothetical protein EmuJ_000986000 [Echinococcus multilocularis]CDS42158.1 hypothetical protein EmuJ_000986100 [Echinococcus multilocularis]
MRRHDDDADDVSDSPYERLVYSATRLYNQPVEKGARVFAQPLRLAIRTREVHPSLLTDTTQRGLIDSLLDAGTHCVSTSKLGQQIHSQQIPHFFPFLHCISILSTESGTTYIGKPLEDPKARIN